MCGKKLVREASTGRCPNSQRVAKTRTTMWNVECACVCACVQLHSGVNSHCGTRNKGAEVRRTPSAIIPRLWRQQLTQLSLLVLVNQHCATEQWISSCLRHTGFRHALGRGARRLYYITPVSKSPLSDTNMFGANHFLPPPPPSPFLSSHSSICYLDNSKQ
ncbi:hypothetical protein J6590_051986 [Homalodisca vitripennis]|nr:hypothetical protein J6590_051986 [Homalodisca vitripennis]